MALFQSFSVAFPAMWTNCLGLISWSLNCREEKKQHRESQAQKELNNNKKSHMLSYRQCKMIYEHKHTTPPPPHTKTAHTQVHIHASVFLSDTQYWWTSYLMTGTLTHLTLMPGQTNFLNRRTALLSPQVMGYPYSTSSPSARLSSSIHNGKIQYKHTVYNIHNITSKHPYIKNTTKQNNTNDTSSFKNLLDDVYNTNLISTLNVVMN